jgi:REP element-mobilizing transposase RayT
MVFAHHLVWTAYGWWLPNDPRGSMSRSIASDLIAELGELHHGRKRIQPASREIRGFYGQAAAALKFPLLRLAPAEADAVFLAFAHVTAACGYTCYACAILPDHVHLCVRKHRDRAEDMIQNLQAEGRRRVCDAGLRAANHPVWGGAGWKVFLDSVEDVERTVRYVEENPVKLGMAPQRFAFVTPYDGWPSHRKRK